LAEVSLAVCKHSVLLAPLSFESVFVSFILRRYRPPPVMAYTLCLFAKLQGEGNKIFFSSTEQMLKYF